MQNIMTAFSNVYFSDQDLVLMGPLLHEKDTWPEIPCLHPAEPTKFRIKLYQVCEASPTTVLDYTSTQEEHPVSSTLKLLELVKKKMLQLKIWLDFLRDMDYCGFIYICWHQFSGI